jgi:hypothetical protein
LPLALKGSLWIGNGILVLGEHVNAGDLFGILPVAVGIYLVTRPAASSRSGLPA